MKTKVNFKFFRNKYLFDLWGNYLSTHGLKFLKKKKMEVFYKKNAGNKALNFRKTGFLKSLVKIKLGVKKDKKELYSSLKIRKKKLINLISLFTNFKQFDQFDLDFNINKFFLNKKRKKLILFRLKRNFFLKKNSYLNKNKNSLTYNEYEKLFLKHFNYFYYNKSPWIIPIYYSFLNKYKINYSHNLNKQKFILKNFYEKFKSFHFLKIFVKIDEENYSLTTKNWFKDLLLKRKKRKTKYAKQIRQLKFFRVFYGGLLYNQLYKLVRLTIKGKNGKGSFLSFLVRLESRLDMILYRSNLFFSVSQIKQILNSKKILVNHKKVSFSHHFIKKNDIISIDNNYRILLYNNILNKIKKKRIIFNVPEYIEIDYSTMNIIYLSSLLNFKNVFNMIRGNLKILKDYFIDRI